MKRKDGLLVVCIAMVLCLCLMPSAMASTEEQEVVPIKDAAQLKMEELEVELGEEGMQEVKEYLELQASLPDVVKQSPYSYIAFAATDKESQIAYMTGIDESSLTKEEKEKLKVELQDIWNRYPDGFKVEDNVPLKVVDKIMTERFIKAQVDDGEAKWSVSIHRYYAKYACDDSSYDSYAWNSADDPDTTNMDPLPLLRFYNHYWDDEYSVGGAPSRCAEFSNDAMDYYDNGQLASAHTNFGYASHYLSDPGIPFHSAGATDYLGGFVVALFNAAEHIAYEDYVADEWTSGHEYSYYVTHSSQSNTVTDPAQAVKDNAEHSAQYYSYITNEMVTNPTGWKTDMMLAYYTAQCVQETSKYNHGLYDYIMS